MELRRAGRAKLLETMKVTPASDEDEDFVHSSDLDLADSGDEADFIDGIDPFHDIVDDIKEEEETSWSPEVPSVLEKGRRRRQPSPNRSCSSRSPRKCSRTETLPADVGRWRCETEPDTLPHSPLHFLPKRTPGVQPPLAQYVVSPSPSELFKMYFDKATIKTLCANTNKNAAKNIAAGKRFKWTEVTEAEMYQYIGMTLYMGILKLPQSTNYWRTDSIFSVPYPAKVMSRDRFNFITCNIHMSDPAEDALNDSRKGKVDYDCLHRIRPLYDTLRVACKAVYHPQKNLSVDERMVGTKAKIGLRQYIKNNPIKWGMKLFALSDDTGYTVDFNIYTGKSTVVSGNGLPFDAVMSLINKNFLGSGYHIYCDHFYTSPVLFNHLHDLGFGACGTFRDTRVGIPKTKENALNKKSPRGTIRWIREGALLFVKWMDTREVRVCSTLHTAFSGETVKRNTKVGGKYRTIRVPAPSAVKDYNRFMGGADLSDQLIGSQSLWTRSRKWYLTVLQHFVDIAVTNSYLVHKELCGRREQKPMIQQAFQEQLTAELCGVPSQPVPEDYQHIPVAICKGASGPNKATKGRKTCKLCGRCTPFMCEACKVALCVIVDRNCHKAYHNYTAPIEKDF